jgi:flagellin-like hook-associated protein FlgL
MAQAAASSVTRDMETAMHRLSTGKRINAAADDAAGVAISSRLDSTVRGLNQSIRNALDAQALIDTAEGGMQETETILQRIRELSIQASNDTNSADDRANLNAEAQSLLSEIDRISSSTTWAGQSLLDGTFTDKSFQVGGGTMASDQLVTSISGASSGHLGLSGSSGSTITTPQKIGSEFQVNTTTTGYQYSPVTTNLENGNFIIAWASEAQDGSVEGSYGQIYSPSGQKIGSEFQINSTTYDYQTNPAVTSLENGGFFTAWRDRSNDGDSWGIFGQIFDASGNKVGAEFGINSTTFGAQLDVNLTTLDNGSVVATWRDYAADGDGSGVFGQIFSSSGAKLGAEFQINSYVADFQTDADVIAITGGGFFVSWNSEGQDGDSYGIYGQFFNDSATKIGSEFRINSTTTGSQLYPEVNQLSDGGLIVAWQDSSLDGSNEGVFAQKIDVLGNKIGTEFQLNDYSTDAQTTPFVQSLKSGGFIATWNSNGQDGSGLGIFGQRFDNSGNKVGDEFQINSYTNSDQKNPHRHPISELENGNLVMTWSSSEQDGDDYGVFVQIFDVGATNVDLTTTNVDLTTMSNSQSAISLVDSALQNLNSYRASLGAISNRLDHIIANNTNAATNVAKSLGRIQDADFAAESTSLAKNQILLQASTAMLAQANASKQNILDLLQN